MVLGIATAAGCDAERYERPRTVEELTGAGLTEAQAACVADGLDDELGRAVLSARREPRAVEQEAVDAIVEACVAAPSPTTTG